MIRKIVKFLTPRATEQLVHSFVTSRLDNCNSLRFGLPDKLIHRLQLLQHRAARFNTHTKKHDHITPVMRSLLWLKACFWCVNPFMGWHQRTSQNLQNPMPLNLIYGQG